MLTFSSALHPSLIENLTPVPLTLLSSSQLISYDAHFYHNTRYSYRFHPEFDETF